MAISVVVAVGAIADPLVSAIKERMGRIRVGPGAEAGNGMGPLIQENIGIALRPTCAMQTRKGPTWWSMALAILCHKAQGSSLERPCSMK